MKFKHLLGVLSSVTLAAGCHATAPLDNSGSQMQQAPCLTCAAKQQPMPAIAVTRPPMCNDYPVAYRVQTPETEPRVRAIDRVELVSNGTLSPVVANCPR